MKGTILLKILLGLDTVFKGEKFIDCEIRLKHQTNYALSFTEVKDIKTDLHKGLGVKRK